MPLLPSLRIRNFRLFQALDIAALGDVNLLVGANNVGKTTVLEAAALYARAGSLDDLARLLSARGELDEDSRRRAILKLERLFFDASTDAELGPPDAALHLQQRRISRDPDTGRWREVERGDLEGPDEEDALIVRLPDGRTRVLRRSTTREEALTRSPARGVPCWYIPSAGLEDEELAELSNHIALKPQEAEAVRALQAIAPEVQRVQVVEVGDSRVPMAGVQRGRVPLRAFGDGVVRLYGLAAALAACEGGLLLIDEFEVGLHYSALASAWAMVFEVAARRGVQVIATSHSGDCVRAFLRAACAGTAACTGALVRLSAGANGQARAQIYTGERLAAAEQEQVEVR